MLIGISVLDVQELFPMEGFNNSITLSPKIRGGEIKGTFNRICQSVRKHVFLIQWTLVSRGDRVANSLITVDMIEEGRSGCFGSYQKTVKRHQPPGYSCQNVSEGHEQNELVQCSLRKMKCIG